MTTEELSKMTDEEKRIRIAELCGYKRMPGLNGVERPDGAWIGRTEPYSKVIALCAPDYLNDLNAMHEAERTLTEWQPVNYKDKLVEMVGEGEGASAFDLLHATAAQRADAFLLTLNASSNPKDGSSHAASVSNPNE